MQHATHTCLFTGHPGVCFSDAECGYGQHCDHPMCDISSHHCHCGRKKHFILLSSDKCVRRENLPRREQQSVLSKSKCDYGRKLADLIYFSNIFSYMDTK